MASRLSPAFESGAISCPEGRILVMRPQPEQVEGLDPTLIFAVQGFFPIAEALRQAGIETSPDVLEGDFAGAIVFVDKSKAETLRMIALAMAHVPNGAPVIIDGDKSAGVASVLKLCRAQFDVGEVFSKAHGKTFVCRARAAPDSWRPMPQHVGHYRTGSGVFSADKIDPGSALLIKNLPQVSGHILDMGAGWGYLSAELLARGDPISKIDLVEAEWNAVDAARENISDPHASIHWANALTWKGSYDWVISNPPFHQGRETTPALGQAFIAQAARMIRRGGRFAMVANRHLPYEAALAKAFAEVTVASESDGFKVVIASRAKGG